MRIGQSIGSLPASLTAADTVTKFRRRLVGDDRVSLRGRMEGPARCAAREVQHAEGTLVEVVLRPLVDGEKDVVHRTEEPRAAPVGFEAAWGKWQEGCGIARTGSRERPRSRHMRGFGVGRAMKVEKILRRETSLAGRGMALRVSGRTDPAASEIGRIGVHDAEVRLRPQRECGETRIQFYPRLLDIPFDLVARRIFREHTRRRRHGAAAGVCERKRRKGRNGQSRVALGTEDAAVVFQCGRVDGDDHVRRIDAEIRQHVLVENRSQKSVAAVESGEEAAGRLAIGGPVETWRHRAGGGAQNRILQNYPGRPAREADIVDADVDQQRVGGAFEDVVWTAAYDGAAQRRGRGGVEAGRRLPLWSRGVGPSAQGAPEAQ